ncbi:MAG: cytidylate kinase-like family protein, partial [Treponema sp.]|nr:cytidylate kinase-like family protein [Treponema sp.]
MKSIITISREYGSGGRLIGKLIADTLNYKFYDKEIIDLAAQESGLS